MLTWLSVSLKMNGTGSQSYLFANIFIIHTNSGLYFLSFYAKKWKCKISCVFVVFWTFVTSFREIWSEYFTKRGIRIAFWSAVAEADRQEAEQKDDDDGNVNKLGEGLDSASDEDEEDSVDDDSDDNVDMISDDSEGMGKQSVSVESEPKKDNEPVTSAHIEEGTDTGTVVDNSENKTKDQVNDTDKCKCDMQGDRLQDNLEKANISEGASAERKGLKIQNTPHMYNGPELLELFKSLHTDSEQTLSTIGMVSEEKLKCTSNNYFHTTLILCSNWSYSILLIEKEGRNLWRLA